MEGTVIRSQLGSSDGSAALASSRTTQEQTDGVQRLQKNPTTPDYLASLLWGVSSVHSSEGSFVPVLPALTDVLLRGTALPLADLFAEESSLSAFDDRFAAR